MEISIVDYLLLTGSSLFIIPLLVQIRYYIILRSRDYLYFSFVFIFAIADEINYAFSPPHFIFKVLDTMTFVGTMTVLVYIASSSTKRKIFLGDLFWKLYYSFVLIGSLIIKYLIHINYVSDELYTPLRIALGETLELFTGIVIVSAYLKLKLVISNKRTIRIKRLWISVGIILIITGIIRIIFYGSEFISEVIINRGKELLFFDNLRNYAELIGTLSVVIIALMTFIFVLVYPESLLISNEQILKVAKLYHLLEEKNISEEDINKFLPFDNKDLIIEYLKSISDKFKEENKENF